MVSAKTADHYAWGDGCDGWHLVRAPGLSVIQERMPPGTAEVRHRHSLSRQFFFVLAGTATLEVDGAVETLGPREGLEVPPGAAHTMSNLGPEPLEFVLVSHPPAHGDREPAPADGR